jgi:hypothetical protein
MKRIFSKLLVLVMFLLGVQAVQAQFTATGTITDEAGEPLIGATVLVKGTVRGTTTDIDGTFSIRIDENTGTLVISYTGFESQEVQVTAATANVEVQLASSAEQLSEVVVVGYGETRKEALTGAVTTLRSDKLENVPLASVEQTLQGNVAGLQANMGNGQPGANVQIRIRGQGSISASS